jgi:hypothetical protein
MPISEDSRAALALLKEVQQSVRDTEDLKNNAQVRAEVICKQLDNSGLKCNCFWVLLSLNYGKVTEDIIFLHVGQGL